MEIKPNAYYAWTHRTPSARSTEDARLTMRIHEIYEESDRVYGVPRIHGALANEGTHVGKKRVARLMHAAGLEGVTRRRKYRSTRDPDAKPAPDLVDRKFEASGPDQLWVADITYIPTLQGFLYLAVVLDVWSRRIVGWSTSATLHTQVVLVAQREPTTVIHHSDQGCQYTSLDFGRRCREIGVRPSMGSVGDAYDNAMCESFFASLECELLDRRHFETQVQARLAVFRYIEGFYNSRRLHSALDYSSPVDYERSYAKAA